MVEEYSQIAAALQPYVDVYLAETLSTVAEAQAALQATAKLGELQRTFSARSILQLFQGSLLVEAGRW